MYTVDGHALALTEKLSLVDTSGATVGMLRRRMIGLTETWDLYKGHSVFATISKDMFNLLRDGFTIDVPGPNDYTVRGSFLDHEYAFYRGKQQVAQVSRAWFTMVHTYGVDIVEGADVTTILATAIVIDRVVGHPG